MSWTVGYSYGTICDSQTFDDEYEAQHFYEMIQERIYEFDNDPENEGDNEYESMVEITEDKD